MAFHSDFRFRRYTDAGGRPGPAPAPGRIYGPVYYIGTLTVCAYLVETSGGAVLVDTGDRKDFEQVSRNVRALGFNPGKITMILNTHWHGDHTGGNGDFAKASGAQVMIHEADADIVESGLFNGKPVLPPCRVDRRLRDNETIRCGETAFKVIHCPGQSPGSAVFLADVSGPDGNCRALFCGDATGFKCDPGLYGQYGYPGAAEHYRKSVEKLKALAFDLYLGGHPHQVVSEIRGDGSPFISSAEWIGMVEARRAKMEAFAKVSGRLLSL